MFEVMDEVVLIVFSLLLDYVKSKRKVIVCCCQSDILPDGNHERIPKEPYLYVCTFHRIQANEPTFIKNVPIDLL